jgi:hypothetical protein
VESTGQPTVAAATEVVRPDRYRMTLTGEAAIPLEMVVIDETTYIRLGGGWQVAPATAVFPFLPQTLVTEIDQYLAGTTIEQEAGQTVDGQTCDVYRSTPPDGLRTAEFCLDPATSLPVSFVSRSGALTITVRFRAFDSGISIEKPG